MAPMLEGIYSELSIGTFSLIISHDHSQIPIILAKSLLYTELCSFTDCLITALKRIHIWRGSLMWKYKCKSQFFSLIGAFIIGFAMTMFFSSNDLFQSIINETMPAAVVTVFESNPWLIGVSGGLGFAGLLNVFLIGSLISSKYPGTMYLFMLAAIMLPDYAISLGMFALPIMIVVDLYGWISLNLQTKRGYSKANISGDDEIVRIYLLHHKLDPKYEAVAEDTKKTLFKVNLAYILGLVAVFCAMFFLENLFISMLLVLVCIFAFQYLARIRASSYNSIASILINECNPEGCLSALIYMSKSGSHYKIKNRALFAQCLIYLNEPSLAQDVLIAFPRSTTNNLMAYYSLMGYIYYLLKDENGLNRCKEEMTNLRPQLGAMGMMVKSEELAALENKINLMKGDFNTCKKYYLNLLKRSMTNLQKSDCEYYIALISFVQRDYVIAKMYFEKVLETGNKLYFVRNAKNYLKKIDESHLLEADDFS